ncbi:MAG TPA: acyl-CoA dehydrogenase family protein [Solirubrobacterales bacterium]|jgi:alkylation response protein AidB-like acyl-CoA dehydrogenase|nr:acyl-CoA dehydrogenase family protein [Solirubrobacterales bacterium]HMW45929.1 acyl-CoA dehydrogenase family protein [Solirubrobacterales bacterium]HMX71652.1 acyl-CoA dehydrogenase family protein [Solirubrobacterales bacterium]HMY26579.1 acyl-CoA dehydrogenase family protein [Solirubrobacterales bacterium]HNC06608.1 acyl-CoA dehydrogenase family protein [Solirubrobacterales bacterium]
MSDAQYALTQDQLDFLEVIRQMVVEKVTPRAHDIDESGEFPQDIRELFAEHDLFGLPFEEKHGGTGTGELMLCAAIEEIAKGCASSSLMVAAQDLSSLPMKLAASDELKDRILPRMASGEWLGAFCLSEPDAGSDPGAMRTRATKVDGGWKLNGAKNWITNSGVADVYVTFAVTDPDVKFSRGITCFAVMGDADGFRIDALEKKMGMKGSPTGQPVYEDVFVPDEDVIGEVGKGFAVAMQTLDRSRLGIGAQALGIAQGATDYAADYAKERIAFGKPINQLQGIQFKLADMETKTAAARELLYKAASMAETSHPLLGKYSAMAKLFASDVAMEVTTEAVQVLGGYGYVREYPVERMMRDAKLTQIYEGTNEIQRVVIARTLA